MNRVERFSRVWQEHRVLSVFIIIGIIVGALATFTTSLDTLFSVAKKVVVVAQQPPDVPIDIDVRNADDGAAVSVNGVKVADSSHARDAKRIPERLLRWGTNSLEIQVYNKASTRGLLGPREGWSYAVNIRANGKDIALADGEDKPGSDHWGTTFVAKRATLTIDKRTREVTVQ